MSKVSKIIALALGGVAVVAGGIVVASKLVNKKKCGCEDAKEVENLLGIDIEPECSAEAE